MDQVFREHHIIFYDGECGFCNASVRWILSRDTHGIFRFASLQSAAGTAVKERLRLPPDYTQSLVAWDPASQQAYYKSRAVAYILKHLPRYKWLAFILGITPAFLADVAYSIVARYRRSLVHNNPSCDLRYRDVYRERFL